MKQQPTSQQHQSRAWRLARLIFVTLLLGSLVARDFAGAVHQKSQSTDTATLVCVVSGVDDDNPQGNMDAVVLIENRKLLQPYPEYNEAAQRKFASEYFASGKKYRLTFGGGQVGSATVKSFDMGCNNIHATASAESNHTVPQHLSALATNSDSPGRKPSSRRPPTDAERQAAMKLVTQIYRSRSTTPALLRALKTTNLTATDLDGDGKFELIGSFVIETKAKARKDLFVIAESAGATFKPALVNFQSYKLPPEGFDSAVDFVDQLDVDEDGIAEVFVRQHGFDAYGYSIYKKSAGRWRKVYTTTGDAC